MERLERASHKAAEELYKSAAPGPGPSEPGAPGAPGAEESSEKKKENVVDAEFKQV
jgi:molecular chaperone DnaK